MNTENTEKTNDRRQVITNILVIILMVVNIGLAFIAGYLVRDRHGPSGEYNILRQAHDLLINYGYSDAPQDPALEYGMIRGMLQAYNDPFTYFSEPAQHELSSQNLEGKFGGIGANLTRNPENQIVLLPVSGNPAADAGVLEGDILIKVDDVEITPESSTETVLAYVRGPVGSMVEIVIRRPATGEELTFRIERAEIALPSVTSYLEPADTRLGVIRVNVVAATTKEEVLKAHADLQGRGAVFFALDLRDNFGGYLDAGIEIARLFLADGVIIEQQYKNEDVKAYTVESLGPLSDIPLVVLVNQNTASAAEIIAGALQAQQRAPLIGTHTYGKDSIQLVFELQDLSSLNVTAAKWWVPGIPRFGGVGLQPDISIPADAPNSGTDPVIVAALEYLVKP
jgi:carboxyl-terminal processing protease